MVEQRRSCLDKAETMMKVLKPQFELFLEVTRKVNIFKYSYTTKEQRPENAGRNLLDLTWFPQCSNLFSYVTFNEWHY